MWETASREQVGRNLFSRASKQDKIDELEEENRFSLERELAAGQAGRRPAGAASGAGAVCSTTIILHRYFDVVTADVEL